MNVLLAKNNSSPERSPFECIRQIASFNSLPSPLCNDLHKHTKAFESYRCAINIMPLRQSAMRGTDNFSHAQVGYKVHRKANTCLNLAASSLTQGNGNQVGEGRLFCCYLEKRAPHFRLACDKIDLPNGNYDAAGHSQKYGYGRLSALTAVLLARP